MANLLVEIGNTALKAAYCEGLTLGKTCRYQGERYVEYLCSILDEEKVNLLVVASVRDITAQDEKMLSARCQRLILLDNVHTEALKAYGLPGYLTFDRAASLLAVRRMFKDKECLVFDLGTTISIDRLSAEGSYLGGNVSLGCRTRFKALNRYSRSLPLVNTPKETGEFGSSISSGIENGIISGIMFEIEGYMNRCPDCVFVFTGGDAEYFSKRTDKPVFVISNLVLMGLASIASDYEDKN